MYNHLMDKKPVFFSRPKDESLEAYKAWIMGVFFRMTGKTESTMTDEEWGKKWKEFWSKNTKKSA
jgi:hypothetical protein